jgi:transcriptional regulatory protein AMDR
VDAFFESIYPTFPVINKEGFLKLYHGANAAPSLLLLQAVLLAGAHAVKVFKNTQELKVALFRRAKTLLEGRYEEDRMEMIQAALLLTWFSDGGDDVCANAWWWIGIAARTAIGLGMHREVGPSKMPEGDKKTWRRMWWCLVQFDCLVSLCSGRSQSM